MTRATHGEDHALPRAEIAVAWEGELGRLVARHALGWLVGANGVGLLLATLLLAPRLGDVLAPLSYGRWATVHLDLELYGWGALPLVGLLFRLFLGPRERGLGRLALGLWSLALVAGTASWLLGGSGGKPFLDWRGPANLAFVAAQLSLAAVLGVGLWRTRPGRTRDGGPGSGGSRPWFARAALWLVLLTVPAWLALGESDATYPPVNPASGGPTGVSLLGSTLGVIWIFVAAPAFLGLERRRSSPRSAWIVALLALHTMVFLGLDHGERTHRDTLEQLALASLLVWAVFLPRLYAAHHWPQPTRRWRIAFLAWGGLLLASALATFQPGVLDRLKFTDGLVAHAHLAMAGMMSAFGMLLLVASAPDGVAEGLTAGRPFLLWQAGCLLQILVLAAAGWIEGGDSGAGWSALTGELTPISVLYSLRWLGGASMLIASLLWWRAARRVSR